MSFPLFTIITQVILPATRPGMQCECVSVSEPVCIGSLALSTKTKHLFNLHEMSLRMLIIDQ